MARRPRTTIVVIALLVAGCAAGWARVHGQSKSDKLWCDTDSALPLPRLTPVCQLYILPRNRDQRIPPRLTGPSTENGCSVGPRAPARRQLAEHLQ